MAKTEDKETSQLHFEEIGHRIKIIRDELNLSHKEIETKLNLPGATMTRLETGKGILVFNLLKILYELEKRDYNIKWIMSFDNGNEFKKNDDNLSLFTFDRKEFHEAAKNVISETQKMIKLANNI